MRRSSIQAMERGPELASENIMSTLRYRGVELERDGVAGSSAAVQLKYRGNRASLKPAHTSQLMYRGIAYSHGVSHQAMRENWI